MQQHITERIVGRLTGRFVLALWLSLPTLAWAGLVPMHQAANLGNGPIVLTVMKPVSPAWAVSPLVAMTAEPQQVASESTLVAMEAATTVGEAQALQAMQQPITAEAKTPLLVAMGGAGTPVKSGTLVARVVGPPQNAVLTAMTTVRPVVGGGLVAMVSATPVRFNNKPGVAEPPVVLVGNTGTSGG